MLWNTSSTSGALQLARELDHERATGGFERAALIRAARPSTGGLSLLW